MSNFEDGLGGALSADVLARIVHAEELLKQSGFDAAHFAIWPSKDCGLEDMMTAVATLIETALKGSGRNERQRPIVV